MKQRFIYQLIFYMLFFACINSSLFSQTTLKFGVFGNGSGTLSGSNNLLNGTLNQTVTGKMENSNYTHFAGFWRGAYHITSIEDLLFDLPTAYKVYQNYPNPFNPSTIIKYDLPKASKVKIVIYNILGQKVVALIDDFKPAGRYSETFNASNLSSGIYFYSIEADGFSKVKRMIFAK